MFYYFLSCDKRFSKNVWKTGKNKLFCFSNFESLNPSQDTFIYEGEKNICNFYFRGLFFKHLCGVYTEICRKIKKKSHIFSDWYVMNVSRKFGTAQKYRNVTSSLNSLIENTICVAMFNVERIAPNICSTKDMYGGCTSKWTCTSEWPFFIKMSKISY